MKMMNLRIILMVYLLGTLLLIKNASAMTIDMGQYLLNEKEVGTKARYVYSDFNVDSDMKLEDASISFNLGLYEINYD